MLFSDKDLRPFLPAALMLVGFTSGCADWATTLLQGASLVASDNESTSLLTENTPPVADGGGNQSAKAGQLVVLNGNNSVDADGDALSFIWQQLDGPVQIELEGMFGAIARFEAPATSNAMQLTFRLIVIDGKSIATDDVVVTITP